MIYLDTSVVVAVLTGEAQSLAVTASLRRQQPGQLWISLWTRTEAAGALAAKVRGGQLRRNRLSQALDDLGNGPWRVIDVQARDYDRAASWAAQLPLLLRGGDALHLAIAHRADFQIATFDGGMAKAAALLGLQLADDLI